MCDESELGVGAIVGSALGGVAGATGAVLGGAVQGVGAVVGGAASVLANPAGLAEFTDALRGAAGLPGVLVTVHGDMGTTGSAVDVGSCARTPIVELGAGLLQEAHPRLAVVLAHEIAHHVLARPWLVLLAAAADRLAIASTGAALLAIALCQPVPIPAGLFVVGFAVRLWAARRRRSEEYAADALSVRLLDQVGLPGVTTVRATLAAVAAQESRWDRAPWPLASHPTAAARIRAIT